MYVCEGSVEAGSFYRVVGRKLRVGSSRLLEPRLTSSVAVSVSVCVCVALEIGSEIAGRSFVPISMTDYCE